MKLPPIIPRPVDIGREALIVVGGALLAAFLLSQWKWGRKYIKDAWSLPTD